MALVQRGSSRPGSFALHKLLEPVRPSGLFDDELASFRDQGSPRHQDVDQIGAELDQRITRPAYQPPQTAGVLCRDSALSQLRFDVTDELGQDLAKRQVRIANAGLSVAVADGEHHILVSILCPAGELGHQGGLARAGLTDNKCHLPVFDQRLIEECVELT